MISERVIANNDRDGDIPINSLQRPQRTRAMIRDQVQASISRANELVDLMIRSHVMAENARENW